MLKSSKEVILFSGSERDWQGRDNIAHSLINTEAVSLDTCPVPIHTSEDKWAEELEIHSHSV